MVKVPESRPTRVGWCSAALTALTLFAAASTGNNLLYLIFAATAAAIALSGVAGHANLRGLTVRVSPPDQAFRGTSACAAVEAVNSAVWTARLIRVVGPDGAVELGDLPPGAALRADLRLVLPHRGRNLVDGLFLESAFPFGLLVLRRRLPSFEVLALPLASPFAVQASIESDPRGAGTAGAGARQSGRDGSFWGPRPYGPDDDARLIHWKLTAKSGRPVVAEYASAPTGKVMVRLEGTDEAAVERAAAACRWFIEDGAEVGLVGTGVEAAPARGLGQFDRLLRALAFVGDGAVLRPAPKTPPARDEGTVDSRGLRRLTLLGVALAYGAMFLIDETDAQALAILGPLALLGMCLHERGGPFPPARLWSVLSGGMLAFLLFVDWKRSGVALANVHLLAYMLINRLLNPWSRGELRQVFLIIYLAFVLLASLTISPWYFPLFLAWVSFAGAWLMISTGAPPGTPRRWAPTLGGLLAAGAVFGAAVFAAAPRIDSLRRFNPFVAAGMAKIQARAQSVMGFSDRVSLGHYGAIRRSSARAMKVKPLDGSAHPEVLYVRGSALDRFDGRTWSKKPLDFRWRWRGKTLRSDHGRAWGAHSGRTMSFPVLPPPGKGADYEFTVYPMPLSILFSIGGAWFIEGVDDAVWFDHTGSLSPAVPYAAGAHYRLRALPEGSFPSDAAVDLDERARRAALELPPGPGGRLAALSARWTAGRTDPAEKIRAIGAGLARGYSYSTYSDGRRTGLDDFLFTVKRGNCEYFATAGALLLRHAGVPARLISGFHAASWNEYGRFYDVRQSDAHAWVEAFVPGRGWTTFDPTPEQSGFSASADALLERLSRWADAAQGAWYRSVVGYDQYAQRDAFLRIGFGRGLAPLRLALARGLKFALGLALLLGAAAGLSRLYAAWRRDADEYERAESALARAGFSRRSGQTAREFARDVSSARPELSAVRELVEEHYRRRWGGRTPDATAKARAKKLLALVKERL